MAVLPIIIVPARLASTRLPEKALLDIDGKPMLVRVLDQAAACGTGFEVIAAVDSPRLQSLAIDAGYTAVLTDPDLPSGTDRVAAALAGRGLDDTQIVINLQGDEPAMPASCITQITKALEADKKADLATLVTALASDDYANPNVVKAVMDDRQKALYFSRSPIPYVRDKDDTHVPPCAYRHIGLYGYRYGALKKMIAAPPAALEMAEKLEQLRALAMGLSILCVKTQTPPPAGVDTEQDLKRIRAIFKANTPHLVEAKK